MSGYFLTLMCVYHVNSDMYCKQGFLPLVISPLLQLQMVLPHLEIRPETVVLKEK